jgi:hypothetical protein
METRSVSDGEMIRAARDRPWERAVNDGALETCDEVY